MKNTVIPNARLKCGRVGRLIRSTSAMNVVSFVTWRTFDATIDSVLFADEPEYPDSWNLTVGY